MCGIAGYFGKNKIPKFFFYKAAKHLQLRGPDNTSFFFDDKKNIFVGLIHTRLSIIDLKKRSNQPFHHKDNIMIFNGEIYNYKELKKTLIYKGYKFNTSSDTEVLIKSFDFWGNEAFSKFEGMWAVVIYNKKKKKDSCFKRLFWGEAFILFQRSKWYIFCI